MKERIGRFLLEDSGIPPKLIYLSIIVWIAFLIYLDREDYKNWDKLPGQEKAFNILKVVALILLIIGGFARIF